jgi:hypothetical protein
MAGTDKGSDVMAELQGVRPARCRIWNVPMPWKLLRTYLLDPRCWHTDTVTISKGKSDLILAAVLRMERFLEHMDSKIVSLAIRLQKVELFAHTIAEHDTRSVCPSSSKQGYKLTDGPLFDVIRPERQR